MINENVAKGFSMIKVFFLIYIIAEKLVDTVHIECGKSDSYIEKCLEMPGLAIPSSAPTNLQEILTRCM
jgi:hypothetical protein